MQLINRAAIIILALVVMGWIGWGAANYVMAVNSTLATLGQRQTEIIRWINSQNGSKDATSKDRKG